MQNIELFLCIDNAELKKQLKSLGEQQGFSLQFGQSSDNWITEAIDADPDIILVQVDDFTSEQLAQLKDSNLPHSSELLFISHGEPNSFIDEAMTSGVTYHLRFPIDLEFVADLLGDLKQELGTEQFDAEKVVASNLDQFGLLLGSSKPMRKLYRLSRKAASSSTSVFIVGESGAGKELVANSIHMLSNRAEKTFISLNCGAISPELIESELFGHVKGAFTGASETRTGVFEHADGSTLFLDEVTEMPIDQQVKLLRVLESGEFRKVGSDTVQQANVRIIAATNREPADAIGQDLFREDLYFRLAQFPIRVPPLRDRGDDLLELARHFLAYRNAEEQTNIEISPDALQKIAAHAWPGNVRELKHTIERAYILADDVIHTTHIVLDDPFESTERETEIPSGMTLEEVERQTILQTLDELDGKKKETAEKLGISVKTLYNKLEKYTDNAQDSE